MPISQKDAVYQATIAVLESKNIKFTEGQDVKEILNDRLDLRRQIRDLIFDGMQRGDVTINEDSGRKQSTSALRAYATGLISNWFRKDKRLNGNQEFKTSIAHVPRHASSIADDFAHDDRISILRGTLEIADEDLKGPLKEAIERRKEELSLSRRLDIEIRKGNHSDFDVPVKNNEFFSQIGQAKKEHIKPVAEEHTKQIDINIFRKQLRDRTL